jgi:hypothetical protein
MSLFDNVKTSDYTELNARLIILEKMFKIFITENYPTLEEMQKMNNDRINNEEIILIFHLFPTH